MSSGLSKKRRSSQAENFTTLCRKSAHEEIAKGIYCILWMREVHLANPPPLKLQLWVSFKIHTTSLPPLWVFGTEPNTYHTRFTYQK
ncbi:hypothetical protein GDO86_011818 [Hymenochirus boettgeri]|uniref:Uncharacterized protein n=1 Tax=Hymenochirus boettgeri TaxID=247094 RepID=A0A8T2JFR8_9PIPI|nr:hypothetical protein GDO86_011818 [Hymenochirus boettgeri]